MRYAAVTPARDEAGRLEKLAASLLAQSVTPAAWIIVENGSVDATLNVASELAGRHGWISVIDLPVATGVARGGPIVRAFHAGLKALPEDIELVMKLDADVSLPPDHFSTLIDAFTADPLLGLASGTCFDDAEGGEERFLTGEHVWGAARAYRTACLRDVLPLEERMGWDGVDEFKAMAHGWRTAVVRETSFRHHRLEGERDGSRWRAWAAQGDVAWFMRYRPAYLVARTAFQAVKEPAATAMLLGYARAATRRGPRLSDPAVVSIIRSRQRLRELPRRAGEATGHR